MLLLYSVDLHDIGTDNSMLSRPVIFHHDRSILSRPLINPLIDCWVYTRVVLFTLGYIVTFLPPPPSSRMSCLSLGNTDVVTGSISITTSQGFDKLLIVQMSSPADKHSLCSWICKNHHLPVTLFYLNFHPLGVVSRYRHP